MGFSPRGASAPPEAAAQLVQGAPESAQAPAVFRPGLTITARLRYDNDEPMTERFNRVVRSIDFRTPNPIGPPVIANCEKNPIAEIPPSRFRGDGGLTFAGAGAQPRAIWQTSK